MKPSGVPLGSLIGYLVGVGIGAASVTLLFLGMRAVLDVGGACADGGPYSTAQPCPTGVPVATLGAIFGLFASAGLVMWFGSRIGGWAPAIVALGWPALFLALGWNFVDYGLHSPGGEPGVVWGWLIPGLLFWLIGGAPIVLGIAAWREARAGRPGNRVSQRMANRLSMSGSPSPSWSATDVAGARQVALPTDPAARPVDRGATYASSAFAPVHSGRSTAETPAEPEIASDDLVADLDRLAGLHANGDLTDDEFARAKADRLAEAEGAG